MTKWLREIAVATVVENAGEGRANSPVVGQLGSNPASGLPPFRQTSGLNRVCRFRGRGLPKAGSHTLQ
jgi:hypothetical protein